MPLSETLDILDYMLLARDRNRSPEERASFLAQAFHVLREADGVTPFDARRLNRWACGPAATNASRQCAAFVLNVYNMHTKWKCGPFNVAYATAIWDGDNRWAFQAWAAQPFTL